MSVTTTNAGITDLKLLYWPSRKEGSSSPLPEEENNVDDGSDNDNEDDVVTASATSATANEDGEVGKRTFVTKVPHSHELIGFHGAMNLMVLESIGLICATMRESKKKEEETNEWGGTAAAATGKGERSSGIVDKEIEYGTTPEFVRAMKWIVNANHPNGLDALETVGSTAKRYLSNVIKHPYAFQYRSFRVGNKVFDRIEKIDFAIKLLSTLGFNIQCCLDVDFVATIPLASDQD